MYMLQPHLHGQRTSENMRCHLRLSLGPFNHTATISWSTLETCGLTSCLMCGRGASGDIVLVASIESHAEAGFTTAKVSSSLPET